jgi:hypothetical protein
MMNFQQKVLTVGSVWLTFVVPVHAAQECWIDHVTIQITADGGQDYFLPLGSELGNQLRTAVQRALAGRCSAAEIILHINSREPYRTALAGNIISIEVGVRQGRASVGGYNRCEARNSEGKSVSVINPVLDETKMISEVIVTSANQCLTSIIDLSTTIELF